MTTAHHERVGHVRARYRLAATVLIALIMTALMWGATLASACQS